MFSGHKMKECRATVRSAMNHPYGGWTVTFWDGGKPAVNVSISNRGGMIRVDSIDTKYAIELPPDEGEWPILRAIVRVAKAALEEREVAKRRVRLLEEMADELRWKYSI